MAVDTNGNGQLDANDRLLSGITVRLQDASGGVIATTTTNAEGRYSFTNLAPGVYAVEEIQPDDYFDGRDHIGTAGGHLVPPDTIAGIGLVSGTEGQQYDFLELEPVSIAGYVYVDNNLNGVKNDGEQGIGGVTLELLDGAGQKTGATVVTDGQGYYEFKGLLPGIYGVAERQPSAYLDGLDAAGSAGGAAHNPGDSITGANLTPATHAVDYNFGEIRPASISGMVFLDRDANGGFDSGEDPLAGVTVYLLDATGHRIASTRTDSQGKYRFSNLAPGDLRSRRGAARGIPRRRGPRRFGRRHTRI